MRPGAARGVHGALGSAPAGFITGMNAVSMPGFIKGPPTIFRDAAPWGIPGLLFRDFRGVDEGLPRTRQTEIKPAFWSIKSLLINDL
jgi:hypothetical protein